MSAGESDFEFTIDGDDDFSVNIGDSDFSTTNIQVEGVDEADIVKCDGKYLYVVTGDNVVIIDAYPAGDAKVLSSIQEDGTPSEIYVRGNRLVVLGSDFVKVYDVSDRENPVLARDVSFNGYYFNSRMLGDYVYLIANSPVYETYDWVWQMDLPGETGQNGQINLPEISCDGNVETVQADGIYYFEDVQDYSYEFATVMAMNTQNDGEEVRSETFLMSTAQNIFVSTTNIYITYTSYGTGQTSPMLWSESYTAAEITVIHKIAIAGGEIEYRSKGEVPGHVLNQFSMDEYQGHFRIATTTGEVWDGSAKNNIYVLDEDLSITGRLEDLAPSERIYSARFMGSRAYLVTFVKVDPLFVIDLTDPTTPRVLGELEIPGYSDYLHPYDETHLIGVGKDATDSGEGFAWYQGVKIALFDVSDPENPVEVSNYIVGERGTDSLALHDHKAFLFSRSKNLLVMPIGDWSMQDAYVFHISVDDGIALRGTITHAENIDQSGLYWYGGYPYSVKRSLYVEDMLYTVSDGMVKINDLADLSEVSSIGLPVTVQQPYDYPVLMDTL